MAQSQTPVTVRLGNSLVIRYETTESQEKVNKYHQEKKFENTFYRCVYDFSPPFGRSLRDELYGVCISKPPRSYDIPQIG